MLATNSKFYSLAAKLNVRLISPDDKSRSFAVLRHIVKLYTRVYIGRIAVWRAGESEVSTETES